MKGSHPGIFERAFPGFFDSDSSGKRKSKPSNLSEDFFYQMAQNAQDIILHARLLPEYKFDYVSPSCFPITGYTPEEFYADPMLAKKCTHPDDAHLIGDPYRPDFKPPAEPVEIRWIRKDGTIIWMEHMITYTQDEQGRYTDCQIIARDITERKKAEEALQENQLFTASILEHAPHATVVINADTSIRYVNPAWERLNGWTLSEVVGVKAPHPWWPEEFREAFLEGFKESMKQSSGKGELISQKKNGELYWIEINWAAVTKDGKLDYMLINSIDITERKNAEKALQDSEAKFSKAFLASPNIMAITTTKGGKFLEVNESFIKVSGYTREEAIGHTSNELNSWANKEDRLRVLRIMKERGRVHNEEICFNSRSGEIHTLLFSMEQIMLGDEPCYISVSNDITERKKMEAALRESEEKFSKVFSAGPNAICLMDVESQKFIEANDSFLKFTGYGLEEIIGHNHIDLCLCEKEEDQIFIGKCLQETGKVLNKRISCRTKSGELRPGLFSADTIEIGGEKRFIIVITDITEQVKAEEALRESEEKFAKAFRDSPEIIAITTTKDGRFVDVNESYTYYTGYSREELLGKTTSQINIWAHESQRLERLKILQKQGRVINKEYEFRTKSGEIRTWLYSAELLTIGGEPCLMSASIDITEHKQMQEQLATEAIRHRILIEQSSDGIVILDQEGAVYQSNRRFAEMLGYSMEEISHLNVSDWEFLYSQDKLLEMLRTVDEAGDHFETQHRRKDGSIYDVEISTNGAYFAGQKLIFCVCRDITERKQMEKAMRESEEKFSLAFNASPISLSISRLSDGKFLEVNESFLRYKGYTREEVIGNTSGNLGIWAYPEERNRIRDLITTQEHAHNEELHYRTKSGEIRTGLVSAEVIKIGNEECMLVLNNDITQQKQAEEQLRLLSSVTKQVSDATIITDLDFRITFMNQAAQDMFGYTIDEIGGKKLDVFNVTFAPEEAKKLLEKALSEGKMHNEIIPKRRKDGTTIICDCRLSPMYDEKGNICSYIDVQRDITKQKDVEAKLQEHKKLIDNILATMVEGVLVIDNHDRIILANKAFYKILHLKPKLPKSKSLSEILPLDQYFNVHRAVTSKNKENNTVEFRYNVEGVEKIIYCVIVKMDGGRKLITFSDVSKEREEEEKLYLTDRLASIGEMAAGLAHELNNPLTGILTLSQVLVNSDIPRAHKEDIDCIHTEAKRAAGIVKNVLLFARNKPDESGRASVNEVVKDVLRLREYEERSSNIKVVTQLEEDLPLVSIDKGQLQQIFLNMISNAEAAIREAKRPGIITVTTERINNHVNIHFSDNGCGIKKHIMPRIFDPFFTTKEVGKGTGLGLSICYSIIVKHGGKISVKSQMNEGTTFTIRMPAVT